MANISIEEPTTSEQSKIQVTKTLTKLPNTKRSVISISDIVLEANEYETTSYIYSNNMLPYATKAVAVFSNEYIPEHFENKVYIKYFLNVNGIQTEVVPINSQRNGIKIIKTSDVLLDNYYSKYVNGAITSCYLTISISCPNKYETPFVSNVKLLVGDEYV